MIQPLDVQRARVVTPDQSVACYAARDGLVKISPAGRLYGCVRLLKAQLPGFEPGSFDVERARKHQFAALRTAAPQPVVPPRFALSDVCAVLSTDQPDRASSPQ